MIDILYNDEVIVLQYEIDEYRPTVDDVIDEIVVFEILLLIDDEEDETVTMLLVVDEVDDDEVILLIVQDVYDVFDNDEMEVVVDMYVERCDEREVDDEHYVIEH